MQDAALDQEPSLGRTLIRVAWIAILFGVVLEGLVLLIAAEFGSLKSFKPFLADFGYKTSWAVIVCVGLAVGAAAAQQRELMMGLLGMLAAPLAFYAARAVHKGMLQAFDLAVDNPGFNPFVVATLKGLEYGVLGAAVAILHKRWQGSALEYTVVGLAVGLIFGSLIVAIIARSAPKPIAHPALVGRAVNELLFPVGCALVLYAADVLGKRLSR